MKCQIFAILAAITVALLPVAAPASAEPQKGDAPGIVNFSEIRGDRGFAGSLVGFGGATAPEAMPWLRAHGFATVINLRFADEPGVDVEGSRTAAEAVGLKYLHLPFDPEKHPESDVVGDVLAAVGDRMDQPVYIHCNSATRVAALWMIGRVIKDGWDIDAARREAESIALKPGEAIAFATWYVTSRARAKPDR
jgi:uncharacterized protein (TIGR01244 family)